MCSGCAAGSFRAGRQNVEEYSERGALLRRAPSGIPWILHTDVLAIGPAGAPPPFSATNPRNIVEWGISIGLIAATIFLFGLGARLMPVLPRHRAVHKMTV